MNNHMSLKLVGANSSLELNSPITSIYLQEELTGLTTLPGIRETKGMNIGMDGGWTSAQFYEPRLITIKGVIANQDVAVVEQRRKQLIQLLAEKRLALEFQTEAGNHYTMNVVVAGVQMPLSKVLTASYFQLNLRADDPLIYDNNALAELEAILRRSSSASSGFTINFPINFQLGTSESRPTIDNFGSSVIYPVITLTGPLTTPEIVNITTNMAFTIDEVLGAGTYTASGIRGAMNQEGSVDTYSGNPIQATRDAESPISKFSLYGKAEQTTYSGKNLLPNANTTRTISGVTFTHRDDGSILVNGTATAQINYPINVNSANLSQTVTLEAGVYTVSDGNDSANTFVQVYYNETGGTTKYATTTFTTTASATLGAYVRVVNNATISNVVLYPMLEKGSTATTYEKYVGGTPAPNPNYPQPISVVTGENVVKIEGKNLFNQGQYTGGTNYGITTTFATEQIKVAGTTDSTHYPTYIMYADGSTTQAQWWATASVINTAKGQFTDSGTYTLSIEAEGNISGHANGFEFILGYMDGTTSGNQFVDQTTKKGSFTATKPINFIAFGFRPSLTFDTTFTIQLEKGTSGSSFEPYRGQEFEVNLGKNLLENKNHTRTYLGITFTKHDDGSFTVNGTSTGNAQFYLTADGVGYQPRSLVLPAGTYTINGRDSGGVKFECNYEVEGVSGSRYSTGTFTATAPITCGIYVNITNGTTVNNLTFYPQLEAGSKATSWSPYFTPIELAKIGNYQDRIYKDDGKWYIEKQVGKVVLDGTETDWSVTTRPNGRFQYAVGNSLGANGNTTDIWFLSDNFTANTFANRDNINNSIFGYTDTLIRIITTVTASASVSEFKTWLSTHNTTVYYALATPTTTEITNEALIDQLDAILEAHLYEGINNISNVTISPNLSGDLEIKTGQTLTVINSLSIVGSSGAAEIGLGGSELAMVGSVADELTISGTTGAVTKTTRIGKIESYAGETITTDYISTSGGLDSDATIYYVLPSSSTSVINTLDSTALTAFNNVVASGGVSAQANIGSISVDVTTVTAQDVAVVDIKQHTVTINGVGAYSKFSGDWLTLDVGLNELQLITENNTDTGSAVIKYRVGYMGV